MNWSGKKRKESRGKREEGGGGEKGIEVGERGISDPEYYISYVGDEHISPPKPFIIISKFGLMERNEMNGKNEKPGSQKEGMGGG